MFRKKLWIPGIKRPPAGPRFFMWGKHRSFSDYIALTGDNMAIRKLAEWSQREKILTALTRYARNEQEQRWYYWMIERNRLHLGLMTTSRDFSGRPSLLLICGCGPLMTSNRRWEDITTLSLKSRQAMLRIAGEEIADMPELHHRLSGLPWPEAADRELPDIDGQSLAEATEKIRRRIQRDKQQCLSDKCVRLETDSSGPSGDIDPVWPTACRRVLQIRPNSMFWGTAAGKTILILFFRQIVENDFIALWETRAEEQCQGVI